MSGYGSEDPYPDPGKILADQEHCNLRTKSVEVKVCKKLAYH
jgi:hypothetical protein